MRVFFCFRDVPRFPLLLLKWRNALLFLQLLLLLLLLLMGGNNWRMTRMVEAAIVTPGRFQFAQAIYKTTEEFGVAYVTGLCYAFNTIQYKKLLYCYG